MVIHRSAGEDRGSSSSSSSLSNDPELRQPLRDSTPSENENGYDKGNEQADDNNEKPKAPHIRWRDLPNKDQLFILSLCRLSEPLSNVCLLPYIFFLVLSVLSSPSPSSEGEAADAAQISIYSGLLVASFPLAQCATSLPWGRFSDRRGRRLPILAGLAISALANAGFGLSSRSSFGALLAWRALAGLANGNVGIMRAATAETVTIGDDMRYRARAFLLLPLVFNAGTAASLALGGCLADPAVNLPWLFGPEGWFNPGRNPGGAPWALENPYALPALMNAVVLAGVLVLAVLGFRETLPGKEAHDDVALRAGAAVARWARQCWMCCCYRQRQHRYTEIGDEGERFVGEVPVDQDQEQGQEKPFEAPIKPPGDRIPFQGIWTRKVLCALVSFGLLPLHNSAFMHIFPVFLSSPASDTNNTPSLFSFTGGLGLPSSTIGLWLSAAGLGGILLQLFIYPRLQSRIGTRGVLRVALVLFPLAYAAAPYLSLLSVQGQEPQKWAFLACVVAAQIAARTMAIPSTVILLTEAAPGRAVLGTVHGAGNTLASLARAVGPAVGGYVFARGVDVGVVGLVWWFYLVVIALCALVWSYVMEGGK
ncbi:major facilitator superfamily domain-containing protein [Camillea tinctor]|nr:major facilitator superfamily domain-containing protein [Camillea tinctor]